MNSNRARSRSLSAVRQASTFWHGVQRSGERRGVTALDPDNVGTAAHAKASRQLWIWTLRSVLAARQSPGMAVAAAAAPMDRFIIRIPRLTQTYVCFRQRPNFSMVALGSQLTITEHLEGSGVPQHTTMIAIVDDDAAVRVSTGNLIRSIGFDALLCASGEELLSSSRLDGTSCVITDVQMPGMSGLDLQDQLQARGYRMPIIFITAYPNERTRRHVFAAGAAGYFSKPFDGTALIECLDNALNESRDGNPD